ncbi:MAG: YHS domain-containing protein [Nitrospirae bacterium]|nr:YHS domain-containing protein [Nitrospirota bacterium]
MNIDPVCGMHVDEKEAPFSYLYRDRAYFFCSEACMDAFSAGPDKYLKLAAEREIAESKREEGGYFSRLLKRLGEHAEKNPPPKCH